MASMTSCEDMMDPKSGSYLYDEDLNLNSPNDSLYTMAALLTKVQQLGDRYVLFGELRGDLVSVSPDANIELKNLSEFTPQENDTYLRRSDFYAVINHCNWVISKMDPTVTKNNEAVLADEYVAAVLYRAWTYLQLGLAYGSAEWITEPVLSLEDSEKEYPVVQLDELVKRLITEVEPYVSELRPNFGEIDGTDARKFFLVPSMFLGDLYLYDGRYDNAAMMYWNAINDNKLVMGDNCIQFNSNTQRLQLSSTSFRNTYIDECVTAIPYSTAAKDYHPTILKLTYSFTPSIKPAAWWIDNMAQYNYYFGTKNYNQNSFTMAEAGGDLRAAVKFADERISDGGSAGYFYNRQGSDCSLIINKFSSNAHFFSEASMPDDSEYNDPRGVTSLAIERIPHAYLRFAEAVNRLGKPTLAYAVIRYGLNNETLADEDKINPDELESGEPWLAWGETFLENNIGSAQRGRGYGIAYPEATDEALPTDLTDNELMLWIEDRIADELAAETAFEGNRFFDLARIAHHRADDSWFAERVSRRFDNPSQAKSLLSNRANWFIR